MMLRPFIGSLLLAPVVMAVETKAPDITQNGIQTAFRVLQKEYIRSGDLTFDELNRAALHGLLERLQFGAELVSRTENAKLADPGGVQADTLCLHGDRDDAADLARTLHAALTAAGVRIRSLESR